MSLRKPAPKPLQPGLLALALALACQGGWAQSTLPTPSPADQGADKDADASTQLPEVRVKGTSVQIVPAAGKTGTPVQDIPRSIQVVERDIIELQNATQLQQALRNVSGVSQGSGTAYGFFDRFFIRGLESNFLRNGLPDGPAVNGYSRSMLGVERIEVLKGPGSALFGSGTPGGSINLVRRQAAASPTYDLSGTLGSFATRSVYGNASGPIGDGTLRYRVDAQHHHSDGFRGLVKNYDEAVPSLEWRSGAHAGAVTLEYRDQKTLADNYGIPFRGNELLGVAQTNRYYTPFGEARQKIARIGFEDNWRLADGVEINNCFAYLGRDVSVLRNSGGAIAAGATTMTGRQLRRQTDDAADLVYQIEPVFRFKTGAVAHKLLIGLEIQRREISSMRETAALPNIVDIFNPVIPETTLARLTFVPNFTRRAIASTYVGAYATDQLAFGRLKGRVSLRADRFADSSDDAVAGPSSRRDTRASWDLGLGYEILPGVTPFAAASRSHLAVNTTDSLPIIRDPERATQNEVGVKVNLPAAGVEGSLALYDVRRENFVQTIAGVAVPVGEQQTRGHELDLSWRPASWLRFTGNLSRQNAVLTKLPADPASQGKIPAGVPKALASLWGNVEYPVWGGRAGFGLGLRKQAEFFANNSNTRRVPGYTVADAAVYYRDASTEIRLDVRNLSDRDHFQFALFGGAQPGESRSVFLTGRFYF